ncbi:MAG: hypothetical protein HBSAPP04_27850 [Ignavibacteriaceae bacterium]|nr:MAG: hypothetical protein HBSAPP04_27850 [Ignavibacteriaceae bacterium]
MEIALQTILQAEQVADLDLQVTSLPLMEAMGQMAPEAQAVKAEMRQTEVMEAVALQVTAMDKMALPPAAVAAAAVEQLGGLPQHMIRVMEQTAG